MLLTCPKLPPGAGPSLVQAECLNQPGVLEGRNLVFCAPTSAGKSLVAEILMLRRLVATGRPALLVCERILRAHATSGGPQ